MNLVQTEVVQCQAERWEHTQKCHQVTGAVANSQYLHKPNSLDLISPKYVRFYPFTELSELKQVLKLLESEGKNKRTKNPCSFVQFLCFLESLHSFASYKRHPVLPHRFTLKTFNFCHSKFLSKRRTRAEMCLP